MTGLMQGCLILSILFNLYINELAIGECVSILMFADDIYLLASSERDLQEMLDVLKSYDYTHINKNCSCFVHSHIVELNMFLNVMIII